MANVLQWVGLAFGIGVIALGVMGFFRALLLPLIPQSIVRTARAITGTPDSSGARAQVQNPLKTLRR
jgi:hypothetical protein